MFDPSALMAYCKILHLSKNVREDFLKQKMTRVV